MAAGLVASLAAATLVVAAPARAADPWWEETTAGVSVTGTWTPVVGDFNGSSDDDIVWYRAGPTPEQLWTSRGDGSFSKRGLPQPVNGDYGAVVGNFGGDGHDDIFWVAFGRPSFLWISHGDGTFTSVVHRIRGAYLAAVLPGEGYDAIAWWAVFLPGGSTHGLASSAWTFDAGGAHTSHPLPGVGYVTVDGLPPAPPAGDFDGDGFGDVVFYRPGPDPDLLARGSASGAFTVTATRVDGGYEPFVADLTEGGDGRADILWYDVNGGSDPTWSGRADGTFTRSTVDVPDRAVPAVLSTEGRFMHLTRFGPGGDVIWSLAGGGVQAVQESGNPKVYGSAFGALVFVGDFTAGTPDLFRYSPGAAPEALFHRDISG